jgi:pilus assembly protein CpaF
MITVLKANRTDGLGRDQEGVTPADDKTLQVVEPLTLPRQYPLEEVYKVHQVLIDTLPSVQITASNHDFLLNSARQVIDRLGLTYSSPERYEFAGQVVDEIIGNGPLEALLREERITDIQIIGAKKVFCEVDGVNQRVPIAFKDNEHLMRIIDRIVSAVNRRVDESSPIVDARLADGSRVNVVLPPVSLEGPAVSIRKFGVHKIRGKELVERKSITPWMLKFLEAAVKARINIIVSGGTSAGKTTLLNTLCQSIPAYERLVTIEAPAELQINHDNLVPLEVRPANLEGKGEITQRHLLKNALRMNPTRIIIGECRDSETFDMLQAMNTGHEGSLTTVHANGPREAVNRLSSLIMQGNVGISELAFSRLLASTKAIIVQAVFFNNDGSRRITHISEITGTQGEVISMQDIFTFENKGVGPDGKTHGVFKGCKIIPECMSKIKLSGVDFEPGFFAQSMEV